MEKITASKMESLPIYAFAEMEKLVQKYTDDGVDIIDFGTGDPRDETPEFIRKAAQQAIDRHKSSGYPSYSGLPEFREEIAAWHHRRFGVTLDPSTEITTTLGSKEGIFNFPFAFLNAGDVVLIPSPGYPPYSRGTLFAGGISYFYPLLEENNFFPDFSIIPIEILKKAKLLWVCYPNNPTGKMATLKFYREALEFCQKHDIILCSDECYIDLSFGEKAPSALEVSTKGVVAFHSLSKRNNMTGYRVGFVCGDPAVISTFKKLKTNIDSGTPNFTQSAGIAALRDERHVSEMREKYERKLGILCNALRMAGLDVNLPEGTFYLWQKVPSGYDGVSFAKRLLEPDIGITVTPGAWISEKIADGSNPGHDYVRFALVESEDRVMEAAQRLSLLHF